MKDIINIVDEKEQFFLDCIKDLVEEKTDNEYQLIYYLKPNDKYVWFDLWIDQKSKIKYLMCSYRKIWSIFEDKFDMKYVDIQDFIQSMVLKHTNWGVVTAHHTELFVLFNWC